MIQFEFLDWLWLILFVLLMVFFGTYFYRMGKRSQSDFSWQGGGFPGGFQHPQSMQLTPLPILLSGLQGWCTNMVSPDYGMLFFQHGALSVLLSLPGSFGDP